MSTLAAGDDTSFDENYGVVWGAYHAKELHGGTELTRTVGPGSQFDSKLHYTSGYFHMKMKPPGRDSAGVVTAFYVRTRSNNDEMDFELLGNRTGKRYALQTNIFINGKGDREQKINLWFDPTADFHDYSILWNPFQIAFFVDGVPIRVLKNMPGTGAGYPQKPMTLIGSIWDGDRWATEGGKQKINWTYAPFTASFGGFAVDAACPFGTAAGAGGCRTAWWNSPKFWNLSPSQQLQYQHVKSQLRFYDYCSDRSRYPTPPPECPV
ncbi:hypothetical protein Taro_010637 [Colocasia esculenta]|uniref:Xyloglucan endotransglucosylase/hydrolase n=1 Tax=Colocasia esculenta TaxID=4460 RepID=A0A843UA59_COLES|nr:hypothetical protein [Colocasia esculenta]